MDPAVQNEELGFRKICKDIKLVKHWINSDETNVTFLTLIGIHCINLLLLPWNLSRLCCTGTLCKYCLRCSPL